MLVHYLSQLFRKQAFIIFLAMVNIPMVNRVIADEIHSAAAEHEINETISDSQNRKQPSMADIDHIAMHPNYVLDSIKLLHREHDEEAPQPELQWTGFKQGQIPSLEALPDLRLIQAENLPNTGDFSLVMILDSQDQFQRFELPIDAPWDGMMLSAWKVDLVLNQPNHLDGANIYAKLIHHSDGKNNEVAYSPTIYMKVQGGKLILKTEKPDKDTLFVSPNDEKVPSAIDSKQKTFGNSHTHIQNTEEVPNDA